MFVTFDGNFVKNVTIKTKIFSEIVQNRISAALERYNEENNEGSKGSA